MFSPKKMIDPSKYAKITITGTGGEIDMNNPNIKWLPYIMQEHTPESLQAHKDFMKAYHAEHEECPKCGSNLFRSSLIGFPLDTAHPEDYKDLNTGTCQACGDVHTVHDRVKIKF